MKNQSKLLLFISAILFLSSCGVITKARYGNGLKLNIESNLFARKGKSETPKTPAKKKKTLPHVSDAPVAKTPAIHTDSFASETIIQSVSISWNANTTSALIDQKKFNKRTPGKSKG
ncbi:MAG: hypothetical protein ACKOXF_12775, partial [Chitinophagaceae bacterium]